MTTIITKIELEGTDNLQYSDVGYTTNQDLINQINEDYDATLGKFLGENRTKLELGLVSLSTFFATTQYVNEARATVEDIGVTHLVEINDINQI
jgi:hypothetical protein